MSETVLDYDVVIIGSGAGGGTVAKELAPLCAGGARIALLEWGGAYPPGGHTRAEVEMAERYYFDHGGFRTESGDMTLAAARAVGGSTSVYTGTSLTIPDHVLAEWAVPGLTPAELAPRYGKYQRENNVHLNPAGELNDNNTLFRDACRRLGWHVAQFPVNTRGCQGLGTCNLGCAVGAKQGTAAVQIPAATAQGVDLYSHCRVDRLETGAVLADVTPPWPGAAPARLAPGRYRFRARRIVVAAGALHSSALLARSLGSAAPWALGRYFTAHPALILVGEHPGPISNVEGHPKSFYSEELAVTERVLLESCMYFPFTLAKNLCGYGPEVDDLIGNYNRLQMVLVLAVDEALPGNRIVSDRRTGRPRVHYKITEPVIRSLLAGIRASARLFFAAGARRVHAPAAPRFFLGPADEPALAGLVTRRHFKLGKIAISAAHLMGGCRMGEDPGRSVTDPWGRVHGRPGWYVADASLFPAAAAINPYLTVMALADRVAEAVRADLAGGRP